MKRVLSMFAIVTVAGAFAAPVVAAGSPAFDTVEGHYEAIRLALLHDSVAGVAMHTTAIEHEVATLQKHFGGTAAGVAAEKTGECETLLPKIAQATRALAAAKSLAAARTAFAKLSAPMLRYRDMVAGNRPMVVYCPMEKESWLQPAGKIGNPYLGQKMPKCGEVVSR